MFCVHTGVHAEDKRKIKQLMYHSIRDLLFYPRGELSDDEEGRCKCSGHNLGTAVTRCS